MFPIQNVEDSVTVSFNIVFPNSDLYMHSCNKPDNFPLSEQLPYTWYFTGIELLNWCISMGAEKSKVRKTPFNEHKPITDVSPREKYNRIYINWCHFFNDDGAILLDTEDLILLPFIDSNIHFQKHLANWRSERQLRLEDKDSALEEREHKGKLLAEILFISEMAIQWHCCRVLSKHIEDKYKLTLIADLHHKPLQILWSLLSPKPRHSVSLAFPKQKDSSASHSLEVPLTVYHSWVTILPSRRALNYLSH